MDKTSYFNNLLTDLTASINAKKDCSVFGLSFGEKAIFLANLKRPIVYISQNLRQADMLSKQMECLGKKVKTIFYKQSELLLSTRAYGQNVVDTLNSLVSLSQNEVDCLIISPDVLMQKFPSKESFKKHIIRLKAKQNLKITTLIQNIINAGYKRVEVVQDTGEFSVRGDVVDIFNVTDSFPTRLDFFDDLLEKIYSFSTTDFKKIKSFNNFCISPATLQFDIDNKSQFMQGVEDNFFKTIKTLGADEGIKLKSNFEEFKINFMADNYNSIQNWITPFMADCSIISHVNCDAIIVFDDVKQIVDSINLQQKEFFKSYDSLIKTGEILLEHKNFFIDKDKVFNIENQKLSFQQITTSNRIFIPAYVAAYKTESHTNYFGNYDLLCEDLTYYLNYDNTIFIFAKNVESCEYLQKYLLTKNICSNILDSDNCQTKKVNLIPFYLPYGAIFVEDKQVYIGSNELFKKEQNKKEIALVEKKEEFTLPKVGDFVVHDNFGIGLCVGIEKLKFTDYEKDYIILQYDKGDKLYLPTEQIGLISAYVSDGKSPKLNRLGTKDFENTKEKVKSSLKQLAFDLIKLYAERERARGIKYEFDRGLFSAFENSFLYDETLDQKNVIEDIKKDMTSGKIMDRLVCGDVGYGKTEVALRGAFICATNSKQVAFLAPTTILSEQHFNTARQRLEQFGIVVECLNRFKTTKEKNEIIKRLKDGQIDIICGTHRLLSSDVKFKDLGLLILDEEQRFGVGDKEKIKRLKTNIDVLSLSATPIPRTLHMGLVGIRDISIIATPPQGRLPVQTTVSELSDGLILHAVMRELNRNGQVLIVYNNIENIYNFSAHLRTILNCPAKIGVAHGQMDAKELENQILDLYNGNTQILVSTTLIENGIDLPNANTLIVINADKLGLSQLYQLKGRVGRSKNLGYAYFTFEKDKMLNEDAYKRLNAIMEFTELGSGFKIAMKDLEIRGCGNIMGPEQHGHMQRVGYDLYCKILNEAVNEIKGQKPKEHKDIKIEVALNCFIPENYITDSENRFRIYNNLKQINSFKEKQKVLDEIKEIYGQVSAEVENLSMVALLKNLASEFDIKKIAIDRERCTAEFYSKNSMLIEEISKALKEKGVKVYYSQSQQAITNFMLSEYSVKRKLQVVCEILEVAFIKISNKVEAKSKK